MRRRVSRATARRRGWNAALAAVERRLQEFHGDVWFCRKVIGTNEQSEAVARATIDHAVSSVRGLSWRR